MTTTKEGRESFAKMHTDAAIKLERLRAKRRALNRDIKQLNAERPAVCEMCEKRPPFSRSPLCFECLKDAQLIVDAAGHPLKAFDDGRRKRLYAARYRYRKVHCGKKDCAPCANHLAHYWYVYRQWRTDGNARETYLGPAEELGSPYELPQLRDPLTSWRRKPKR